MTGILAEKEMLDIAGKVKADVQNKLLKLDSSEKTARKAYSIIISIIGQTEKMVLMKFSEQPYDEKYYSVREMRVFGNGNENLYFSDKAEWYSSVTDPDLKESFLVYAHAVQMMRSAFLDKKEEELMRAKDAGCVDKIFEASIIVDTLKELLNQWKLWWEASGVEN